MKKKRRDKYTLKNLHCDIYFSTYKRQRYSVDLEVEAQDDFAIEIAINKVNKLSYLQKRRAS
jgi:hypothetical protein